MREIRSTGLLIRKPSIPNLSAPGFRDAWRRAVPLTAIAFGMGLVMIAGAAHAGDDDVDTRSYSEKLMDNLKAPFATTNMESKGIDYRERSPLVVPPSLDLPPPAGAAAEVTAPNWPKDPDEKRRKAAVAARQKRLTNSTHELTPAEVEAVQGTAAATANQPPTPPPSFTDRMTNLFKGNETPEVGRFKGEPPRESLTEPPAGYRIASPNYAYGIGQKAPRKDNKEADNKDPKESAGKQ